MQDFSGLPTTLADALAEKGYNRLTHVQHAVTGAAQVGHDLLVSAQTGSGKTVGFGLAIASDVLDADGRFGTAATPLALVIAPTRELALQVRREFDWLFANAGIVTASAVGGMDARTERRTIERGVHVIVATPGRLRDHIARGVIDLSDLKAVVLDEADEMLDMGFAEDLEFILDQTPDTRRTLLFSATVPHGIAKLAKTYQKEDTQRIEVGSQEAQHADIAYQALNVLPSDIEKAILNLLRFHDAGTAIVFANTRSTVARLAAKLSNRGFSVVSLSGELSQSERTHALQALRDKRAQVCVATDVAARGIDLPGLDLVIHADLPSNAEGLLHRSGRTGRAGRKGTSILIVPSRQRTKAQRLLKTAKLSAEWGAPPSADDVLAQDEDRILSDPAWDDALSPEAAAFAGKLLGVRSAEEIAAAYLRLYRERYSAPEILGAPSERDARQTSAHDDFGPSVWFSLSFGRKHRAEPRWLLPMLCRNTGLSKDAIGAIRVQYQETFVEIAAEAVPAMKEELGPELGLEQGATLTELSGVPDFDASPKGPSAGEAPAVPTSRDRKQFKSGKPEQVRKPGQSDRKPARKARRPENTDRKQPEHARPLDKADPKKVEKPRKPERGDRTKNKTPEHRKQKPENDQPATKRKPIAEGQMHSKGKPASAKAASKTKPHGKAALDPSKPLKGRTSRQNLGAKDQTRRTKTHAPKGGDAAPFRKPTRRS